MDKQFVPLMLMTTFTDHFNKLVHPARRKIIPNQIVTLSILMLYDFKSEAKEEESLDIG